MSPESTHKLMGFFMKVLTLGSFTSAHGFCFVLVPIECIGLTESPSYYQPFNEHGGLP